MKNYTLLATLSGFLLAFAWPTYGVSLLLFTAFVPLMLAEKKIRTSVLKRKALKVLGVSYLCFVIWNSITTWWLWYSTPFGMFFAILVNSLLMALVFLLYHFVARKLPSRIHLIFLPAIWMAFEKFHLNWDFSWPWLNLGNAFSESTSWIQWYEYTGTFGGSLWVWIVNIGIFKTIEKYNVSRNRKELSSGIAKNILIIAIPIIISLFILKNYKEPDEMIGVVLLQPNVNPYTEKYDSERNSNSNIAHRLIALAKDKVDDNTVYFIGPETVLADDSPIDMFPYSNEKQILQSLAVQNKNMNVLVGASFFKLYQQREKPTSSANRTSRGDWYDIYNAAVQLNKNDSIQTYIKSKLVVGVENLPFKSILEPLLGNIMLDLGGTVASRAIQDERSVFISSNGKYKAAPIICYESVYGEYVTDYVSKGANFLAIITNDAWWDNTQGHKQHLSYARLRAIETRRSVARSANTGISALINQKGEILDSLPYATEGALKGNISVNNKLTFYVRYGDLIARIAIAIAVFIFLFAIAKKKG